ncbi:MAG: ABC transporter ATP-binding protein [Lachnospiraceae bacterium]|nr:ABC transporter ATP-binding protein [Lachnospiraceae bacterium]
MLGEAGMDLLQPTLMSTIVDEGVLGLSNGGVGDPDIVLHTGIKMILLILAGAACGILSGVFANIAAQNFGNDLRKDAFHHIMHFSLAQTDRFTTGSLITRVTNDVTQVQNMVQMAIRGFVRTMILLAGGMICMMRLHLSFGAVLLIAMPLLLITMFLFLSRVTPNFSVLQKRLDDVNNVMQENVAGNRVVKAYIREAYETERFSAANEKLVSTQLQILLLLNYMTPIMNILMNLSLLAVIYIGGLNAQRFAVSPGHVMAAVTYLTQILNALMRMGMMFQNISRGMASAKRLREVIHTVAEITDGPRTDIPLSGGSIEFRDVSFGYAGRENILNHISFTVHPGETIGILGMTGSGKSSLIQLIPRFYDVTEGAVLVDGVDVRDYPLAALRSRIAVALQKSELFHRSIRENIAWGDPSADEDALWQAARTAQAEEFITAKADGMDTIVAQSGHSLSGGQKQRLAIARAVLKNAEILIFDDSTSALDLKTESSLYKALHTAYSGQTRIIVAQRIASVKDADRILVLEDGAIAACGSHEELLAASPIYQDICRSQTGGAANG